MNDLYKVRNMLVDALREYGKEEDLSKPALDNINKLAHAAKNVCKVIKFCEEDEYDYSNAFERSRNSKATGGIASDHVREELHKMIDNL